MTDWRDGGTVVNFGAGDYGWMLLAVLVLFVPGGLVLAAAGWASRRRAAVGVAIAPLVSIAVCYAAAVVTGLLGLSYGLVAVAVTTVAVAVVALAVCRLRAGTVQDTGTVQARVWRAEHWRGARWSLDAIGGVVLAAVALGISVRTWGRGLGGSLATVPQEHDMITHTLLTAHIARSGEGAPWKVWSPDLLTSNPGGFYPSGFHSVAALVVDAGADPVTAVNATMVVVLALCLPLGLLGLATLVERAQLRYVVGGVAGLVGAMAYRPIYALFHDGGILANAMAIALAPAALAGLLALRERGADPTGRPTLSERSYWVDCCLIAAVAIGAFAVHPTSAAILGLSVAAWSVGELAYKLPRVLFWSRLLKLALGAALMAVLALPLIRGGGSSVGTVAAWPRDVAVQSFPQALGSTLGMPYGGFLDFTNVRSQSLFAVLVLAGVVAVLVSRRGLALGAVWAAWSAVLLAFLAGAAVPGLATVTGVFYSSYVRISGVLGPFQWLMVGVAVTTGACLLVRAAEAMVRENSRAASVIRPRAGTGVVVALVLALVLLAVTGAYRATNGSALAGRYAQPDFTRVDGDDRAAISWMVGRVQPGERVMNSANDGSTYLYVYDGIPVVNVSPLGSGRPDTDNLLARFNRLDTDQDVRRIVRDLDIRWVYVDADAPGIGVVQGGYPWYTGPSPFTLAPGLTGLDAVAGLDRRFTSGSVSVYEVDPSLFAPAAHGVNGP